MPSSQLFTSGVLFGFLFVLARIAGLFTFAPLPGIKEAPPTARALLSLSLTIALFPVWPKLDAAAAASIDASIGRFVLAIVSEAALGLAMGLAVAFVTEALQMAAQVAGLQAGYGYASTVDPATQADSSVLLLFAQLFAGLLFFATGLDREIIRACAASLDTFPPGSFRLSADFAESLIRLGQGVFGMGLRLALPIVALLGMVDLSLALLGRINSQLQLITLAFPIKMLSALALLGIMTILFERVFVLYSGQMLATVRHLVARP